MVTDGRSVVKRVELPSERLIVGQCKVCRQVDVSVRQRLQASIKCPVELLMFTEKTNSCMNNCNSMTDSAERSGCQLSCQQYNRCLESTCVEALRRKLKDCGRQCDREMQSSMAADIDVYDACMSECKIIKQEISSCPVL